MMDANRPARSSKSIRAFLGMHRGLVDASHSLAHQFERGLCLRQNLGGGEPLITNRSFSNSQPCD
jgi:hypothetical protein